MIYGNSMDIIGHGSPEAMRPGPMAPMVTKEFLHLPMFPVLDMDQLDGLIPTILFGYLAVMELMPMEMKVSEIENIPKQTNKFIHRSSTNSQTSHSISVQ